jgi:hypothetical protein
LACGTAADVCAGDPAVRNTSAAVNTCVIISSYLGAPISIHRLITRICPEFSYGPPVRACVVGTFISHPSPGCGVKRKFDARPFFASFRDHAAARKRDRLRRT